MDVTVNFFGFLRKLNEIDATFKYLYLEDTDFNTEGMRETLQEIQRAVSESLQLASKPSQDLEAESSVTRSRTSRGPEQPFQPEPALQFHLRGGRALRDRHRHPAGVPLLPRVAGARLPPATGGAGGVEDAAPTAFFLQHPERPFGPDLPLAQRRRPDDHSAR